MSRKSITDWIMQSANTIDVFYQKKFIKNTIKPSWSSNLKQ